MNATTEGRKDDGDKVRVDLLSPVSVLATAGVLSYGAKKYGERNWEKGIHHSRLYAAALRHLMAYWLGEDVDPETGLRHIDHAACCVHFLQHLTMLRKDLDDRPNTQAIDQAWVDVQRAAE